MELSKFHGIPWNSMELPFWHGKVPWNSMEFHGTSGEFHGIPWNSMELWNIDINKFHNWGSVFHCFLYDFMSLYIRQSISSWNIEIFQFQSNFLVPLILVKWRYSILNGGLLSSKWSIFQIEINKKYNFWKIYNIVCIIHGLVLMIIRHQLLKENKTTNFELLILLLSEVLHVC